MDWKEVLKRVALIAVGAVIQKFSQPFVHGAVQQAGFNFTIFEQDTKYGLNMADLVEVLIGIALTAYFVRTGSMIWYVCFGYLIAVVLREVGDFVEDYV